MAEQLAKDPNELLVGVQVAMALQSLVHGHELLICEFFQVAVVLVNVGLGAFAVFLLVAGVVIEVRIIYHLVAVSHHSLVDDLLSFGLLLAKL